MRPITIALSEQEIAMIMGLMREGVRAAPPEAFDRASDAYAHIRTIFQGAREAAAAPDKPAAVPEAA